jgi:hypothetical protein
MKYYTLLSLYYVSTLIKYAILCVAKPASAVFGTIDSTVSEWEPNKPLHTSNEPDPLQDPDNLGI